VVIGKSGRGGWRNFWEGNAERVRGRKAEAKIEDLRNVNENGEEVEDDEDEDWEDEETGDVPQLLGQQSGRPRRSEPEVDEDGFTVVKQGSKRHWYRRRMAL
jgi:pre-rRNA-processing protein TSR2